MPRPGELTQLSDGELSEVLAALSKGATLTTLANMRGFTDRRPLMRRLRRQVDAAQYQAILEADRAKNQAAAR